MRTEDRVADGILLSRAANGDEDAFASLYRRHQGVLFRFALRMTGSQWAAEEIVQDTFMTLVREPRKYDATRGELRAFLFGVARNRILKHLERSPRDLPLETNSESTKNNSTVLLDSFTPAAWAEQRERVKQVREAVLALPPEFREAVVLCELEEMSYEEAAQALGCPIGTIRSRLHRAKALLLAKLELLRDVPARRANAVS